MPTSPATAPPGSSPARTRSRWCSRRRPRRRQSCVRRPPRTRPAPPPEPPEGRAMKRVPLSILLLLLGLTAARAQTADERKATVAYLVRLQNDDGGFLGQAPTRNGRRGEGSSSDE